MDFIRENIALLIPLFVIQLALMIAALVDLLKRENQQVTGGNKLIWILVIVLVNLIGPIIYFVAGRRD
jgi:hypothetical protein